MKNNYKELTKMAEERIKHLKKGTQYNLDYLFDKKYWASLPVGKRRGFGRVFSNMVSRGEIKNTFKTEEAIARNCAYIKL